MGVTGDGICAQCGAQLDAVAMIGGDLTPDAGDWSICFYCGNLAVFTGQGVQLREPTPTELAEMLDNPVIRRALRWILRQS